MYYHAIIRLSGNNEFVCTNETESQITNNYLLPFINGQVIEADKSFGSNNYILVNMKSASTLSIYKSNDKITEEDLTRTISKNSSISTKFDCTHEFIHKVKQHQANPAIKSLLEMAFKKPIDQAFIIMKFGDKQLDSAYEGVIKPLIKGFNLEPIRVDEIQDSGKINEQILENISKSKIIISDLTGERPNCYYETGFAHALGKDIILTIHKSSEIHFDLSSHRFIMWETELELREGLRKRMKSIFG